MSALMELAIGSFTLILHVPIHNEIFICVHYKLPNKPLSDAQN